MKTRKMKKQLGVTLILVEWTSRVWVVEWVDWVDWVVEWADWVEEWADWVDWVAWVEWTFRVWVVVEWVEWTFRAWVAAMSLIAMMKTKNHQRKILQRQKLRRQNQRTQSRNPLVRYLQMCDGLTKKAH